MLLNRVKVDRDWETLDPHQDSKLNHLAEQALMDCQRNTQSENVRASLNKFYQGWKQTGATDSETRAEVNKFVREVCAACGMDEEDTVIDLELELVGVAVTPEQALDAEVSPQERAALAQYVRDHLKTESKAVVEGLGTFRRQTYRKKSILTFAPAQEADAVLNDAARAPAARNGTTPLDKVVFALLMKMRDVRALSWSGLGVFVRHDSPAYLGKNPRTGEAVEVAAHRRLVLKSELE